MNEINYPPVTTYFIAYTVVDAETTIYANGTVEPDQCMTTGLENLDTYTDFNEYTVQCNLHGLEP